MCTGVKRTFSASHGEEATAARRRRWRRRRCTWPGVAPPLAGTHPVGTCEKAGRSCHPRQKREQNSRCLTAKDWCDRCAHAAAARASSLWVRVSRQAEARSLSDLLEGNGSASAWASGLRAQCRCSSERERARASAWHMHGRAGRWAITGERAGGRVGRARAGRAFAEFSAPSFCNVLALCYLKCDEPVADHL